MHTTSPARPRTRLSALAALALVLVVQTIAAVVSTPPAVADLTSNTDDKSVAVPTGWWTYTNVSESQVAGFLSANQARLTDIEIYSITGGVPRFTVTMVRNAGAYAVPGWSWYYGQSFAQVGSLLASNSSRPIRLLPYSDGGTKKFAVIMVANTGATARGFTYQDGATYQQVVDNLANNNQRLIDIETYGSGSSLRYTTVAVTNAGSDAKAWQWWLNQTSAQVSTRLQDFNGRLVRLNRQANGNYDIILVQNAGSDGFDWTYWVGLSSLGDLTEIAQRRGERLIDVETYLVGGQRRYAGVLIDNSNAATGRIRGLVAPVFFAPNGYPNRGAYEAYLKQAGGPVVVDLNGGEATEVASAIKVLHLAHSYKQIQNGSDSRNNAFTAYNYPNSPFNPSTSNACPITGDEVPANVIARQKLGTGLDLMMSISDNRTTRGVLLRYGRAAIQGTANAIGMGSTVLRSEGNHNNLGCFYYNPETEQWTDPGNSTTAEDLAKLYESVDQSTFLSGSARTAFLTSANPATGAPSNVQAVINDEAASLGKPASVATAFGQKWKSNGKGGSYSGKLASGQAVRVLSGAGIAQVPFKNTRGAIAYRDYVYGNLYSNTPVGAGYPAESTYQSRFATVGGELFREVIRSALQTW